MKLVKTLATSPVLAAVLFLIGCVVIAENPSTAQVWRWSQTSSSNATADPNINWAEGMSPSAVNDSARAMMTAVAQVRDDWSGANISTGTASAFTLTSNQGFPSLANMNNQKLCFRAGTTNAANVTLSVDSLTPEPILTSNSTPVGAGVLILGTPYCVVYVNSTPAFYLQNFVGNPYNIPLGGLLYSTVNSAPNSNFVFANGQAISRTTYSAYFALVSTTYGSGDGTTTFNVPDLRARMIAGLDGMGGSGITTRISTGGGNYDASVMGQAGGNQSLNIAQNQLPNAALSFSVTSSTSGKNYADYSSVSLSSATIQPGATSTASLVFPSGQNPNTGNISVSGSGSTSSINGGVSQQQTPYVNPSMALPIFVRIF